MSRGKLNSDSGSKSDFSLEEFFLFYYPRLKKYAQYFVKSEQEADDLVQDVFLQLWKEQGKLNKDLNIPSYTFALLKNRCLDFLKRKVIEDKYLAQQAAMNTEELYFISFGEAGEFRSLEELLFQELQKLVAEMPERCGTAFRLKWIEGKKIREIAEIMNISTTMVDKHLAKGLSIVRERFLSDLFLLFLLYAESTSKKDSLSF